MVVELLCIVLMALVFYLIYCPEDPLGIVMKYRKITCLPVVNCCYHTTHVCEPFSTTHHRKKRQATDKTFVTLTSRNLLTPEVLPSTECKKEPMV
uniref:Secreted protein n=1 Tax=Rhabditophanes sp. KR3021 TaxID=114890 RepID=A0AC35UDN6_9BILA